jgi:hypothetical protein
MVIHLIGDARGSANEGDSIGEAIERVRFDERISAARPTGKSAKRSLNFQV